MTFSYWIRRYHRYVLLKEIYKISRVNKSSAKGKTISSIVIHVCLNLNTNKLETECIKLRIYPSCFNNIYFNTYSSNNCKNLVVGFCSDLKWKVNERSHELISELFFCYFYGFIMCYSFVNQSMYASRDNWYHVNTKDKYTYNFLFCYCNWDFLLFFIKKV